MCPSYFKALNYSTVSCCLPRASGGFEANQAEVCHARKSTFILYLCWYVCVHVSQSKKLNVQTTALMMQALWSGSLTLALLHYSVSRHLQGLCGVPLKSF